MVSFEVCHVLAHKCNPASKVLRPDGAMLFTLRCDVHKKMPFISLDSTERCRIDQEKQAMGWLEKAERGEQRQLRWQNPSLDTHGSLGRGVIVKSHPVTKSISTVCADQSQPCSGNNDHPGRSGLRFAHFT